MFTTTNKLITDGIDVELVNFLLIDVEQQQMVEPALMHCTAKVSLQAPHGQKATLTDSVASRHHYYQASKKTHFNKK